MSKSKKQKLFCTKCSFKFGNTLAKFSTNFAFKLHSSIIHKKRFKSKENKEKEVFKCQLCGYNFATNGSLNLHIALVHDSSDKNSARKENSNPTCCFIP